MVSKNLVEKPFSKVLFALGIRFVGETVAKKLAKYITQLINWYQHQKRI